VRILTGVDTTLHPPPLHPSPKFNHSLSIPIPLLKSSPCPSLFDPTATH
jgi:hypothetical protein